MSTSNPALSPSALTAPALSAVGRRLTAASLLSSRMRRRVVHLLSLILLTAAVIALVTVIPRGDGASSPALLLQVGSLWLLLAVTLRLIADRRAEQLRSRTLSLGLVLSLAALAAVSLLRGEAVPADVALLLLVLALVHQTARPPLRMLLDRIAPSRAIVVCAEDDLVRHPHSDTHRVRGFSAETLADPDFVVRAVRHDIARGGADRVELLPGIPDRTIDQLAWALREDDVDLLLHQPTGKVRSSRTDLVITAYGPGLLLMPPRPGRVSRAAKRAADVLGAAVLLALLSPVLLLTALAVRREDGGAVLYRQERIGLDGRPFMIYKFRTMIAGADAQLAGLLRAQNTDGAPLFKVAADPRLTRCGSFLRRSSIDELPQLLNVLEGTMSLVGPRPQRAAEVALYDGNAEHRLGVRPGMTGLWQVSGRSRLSWEQARELDVYYAHNWSPALDLTILLRTVRAVAASDGAV